MLPGGVANGQNRDLVLHLSVVLPVRKHLHTIKFHVVSQLEP